MEMVMAIDPLARPVAAAEYGVLVPMHIYFDEFDQLGVLHHGRYPVLADRAWNYYWETQQTDLKVGVADAFNVVKELHITFDAPVSVSGPYAVHLWVERMGRTSVTGGFRICSRDGDITYAHGTRTNVRLDAETLRPAPWSEHVRELAEKITRPTT
jgi:acyl-CoA thioester hydrolase